VCLEYALLDAANGVLGVDGVNGKSVRYYWLVDEGEVGERSAIADKNGWQSTRIERYGFDHIKLLFFFD